jgi:hypothetical protein
MEILSGDEPKYFLIAFMCRGRHLNNCMLLFVVLPVGVAPQIAAASVSSLIYNNIILPPHKYLYSRVDFSGAIAELNLLISNVTYNDVGQQYMVANWCS